MGRVQMGWTLRTPKRKTMSKALESLARLKKRASEKKRPPHLAPVASGEAPSTPETYPKRNIPGWRELLEVASEWHRELWEERAAIIEHEALKTRQEAEDLAGADVFGRIASAVDETKNWLEDARLEPLEILEPTKKGSKP